jgi:hypothetical protein
MEKPVLLSSYSCSGAARSDFLPGYRGTVMMIQPRRKNHTPNLAAEFGVKKNQKIAG